MLPPYFVSFLLPTWQQNSFSTFFSQIIRQLLSFPKTFCFSLKKKFRFFWSFYFCFLFHSSGLFKQQEFMKSTPTSPSSRAEMYIRQATPETYREVLKDIRQKEIYKLIIDTNSQHMSKFFRAVSVWVVSVSVIDLCLLTVHFHLVLWSIQGKSCNITDCIISVFRWKYRNWFVII